MNLLRAYRTYISRLNVEADLRFQITLKISNNATILITFFSFVFVVAFLFLFSLNLFSEIFSKKKSQLRDLIIIGLLSLFLNKFIDTLKVYRFKLLI